MATIDRKSRALIADVNTSQCNLHLVMGDDKGKLKLKQDDLSSTSVYFSTQYTQEMTSVVVNGPPIPESPYYL